VAKALATSLAPMPNAAKKAAKPPSTTIHVNLYGAGVAALGTQNGACAWQVRRSARRGMKGQTAAGGHDGAHDTT
jgi:hypothetical protein